MTSSGMESQVEAKNTSIKNCLWVLQYKGEKGIHIVNLMKRYVKKKKLPENVKVQTAYSEKRLKSSFKTEDKTNRASTRYYIQDEVSRKLSGWLYWIAEALLIK